MNAERKKRQPRFEPIMTNVGDAVSTAFSMLEELKDELQNWYDNLPESFQSGSKGDTLQEAIDALENIVEPDVSENVRDAAVTYQQDRKATSRAKRCAEACTILDACIGGLQEVAQDWREKAAKGQTGNEGEDLDALADECDTLIDELDTAKSDAEGVEFPGMYG